MSHIGKVATSVNVKSDHICHNIKKLLPICPQHRSSPQQNSAGIGRSRENTGNGRVPGSLSGRTWIHSNWGKLKTQSQKWVEKRGFILLLFILNDFILLFILNDFTYNKLYTSLNTLHKMDGNLDKPELENRMRSGNYQIQWKKLHQLLLHDRSYSVLKLLKWT